MREIPDSEKLRRRVLAIVRDIWRTEPDLCVTDLVAMTKERIAQQRIAGVDTPLLNDAVGLVFRERKGEVLPPVPSFDYTIAAKPVGEFRSKLEAQWATVLSRVGIAWEFEPRTFHEIHHTPDFYLSELKVWLQIKPRFPDDETRDKAAGLTRLTGEPVYVVCGPPSMTTGGSPAFASFRITAEALAAPDASWLPQSAYAGLDSYPKGTNWELIADALTAAGLVPQVRLGEIQKRREAQAARSRRNAMWQTLRERNPPAYIREFIDRPYVYEDEEGGI